MRMNDHDVPGSFFELVFVSLVLNLRDGFRRLKARKVP